MSRRVFIGSAAATGAVSFGFVSLINALPRSTVQAAFAQAPDLRFFDEHQAAVIVEASARLIPGPTDDPAETTGGAREAGVVHYIDLFLSAFDDDPPRIYAGGPVSDRNGGAQDYMAEFIPLAPYLDKMWRDRIATMQDTYKTGIGELDAAAGGDFTTVSHDQMDAILIADTPSKFRRVLFEHTVEGMYAIPEYGGNSQLAGWDGIPYSGDVAPKGWTPDQVSNSDGPDPVPAGFEMPFPAQISGTNVEVQPSAYHPSDQPDGHPSDQPEGATQGTAQATDAVAGVAPPGQFLNAALPGLGRWRTTPPSSRRAR